MSRVAGKVAQYLVVAVVVLLLNFLLPRALPGGPLAALRGGEAGDVSGAERARLLAAYGLDRPLPAQFADYVGDLLRGDLGRSFVDHRPVGDLIGDALPWTLLLVGSALLVTAVFGVLLGVFAGARRERTGVVAAVLVLDAMPAFWLGMILISVFGVQLAVLPTFGATSVVGGGGVAAHLVLPVLTLVLTGLAQIVLVVRSSMISVLGSAHLEHARARGLSPRRLLFGHALRNAALPVYTVLLIELGYLVGGALVVETVFAYPGLGRLTFDAVLARDYPVMQGTFLVLSLGVLVANLLADLTYPLLDPRVRAGEVAR